MVDKYLKLLLLLLLSSFLAAHPLRADEELPDLDMALGEDNQGRIAVIFSQLDSLYRPVQPLG